MCQSRRRSGQLVLSSFRLSIRSARSRSRFLSVPLPKPEWRKRLKSPKHERQTLFSIYHALPGKPDSRRVGQTLVNPPEPEWTGAGKRLANCVASRPEIYSLAMNRRQFLFTSLSAPVALNTLASLRAQNQETWGGPVLDIHLHAGQNSERVFNHAEGSGETRAVLLAGRFEESAKAAIASHPGRFVRFASADVTKPDAVALLTKSLREGAIGIGEIKYHVALDGPEMRMVYDLAAEAKVPVTVHFQEIPHFDGEGMFNTGFPRLGDILKAYPRTTILGHADAFWANVSADVPKDIAYPGGRIKPGGLSDKWLAEFPNLYGDMSANSCNTALYRDPDFMRGFLDRHQDKLIFGSDCPCTDGHGTGVTAEFVPRTKGKCLARETLTLLKQLTTPEIFRKITWTNGVKLLKLSPA
jgi:uncharacterized protein